MDRARIYVSRWPTVTTAPDCKIYLVAHEMEAKANHLMPPVRSQFMYGIVGLKTGRHVTVVSSFPVTNWRPYSYCDGAANCL